MKNSVRVLGASILITIYCLAVGTFMHSAVAASSTSNNAFQEQYSAIIASNLFSQIFTTENSVEGCNTFSGPSFKNTFSQQGAIKAFIQILWSATFANYNHTAVLFWIQHKKSDILFPFHFFW